MTATVRRRNARGLGPPPPRRPGSSLRSASRRTAWVSSSLAIVALVVLFLPLASAAAEYNPTKCSACEAVASELRRRLDGESRTAPVDLRGRLGPSAGAGNRRGRLVEWRKSEQRAVELLDGLCAGMAADYRLVGEHDGGHAGKIAVWRKYRGKGREEGVAGPPTSGPGVAAHEAQQKQLAAACGLLLEEVEEELVAALREDGGGGGEEEGGEGEEEDLGASKLDVGALLCRRLTRRCEGKEQQQQQEPQPPQQQKEEEANDDDDDDTKKGRGGEL